MMTGEVRTQNACYAFPNTVGGPFGFQISSSKHKDKNMTHSFIR